MATSGQVNGKANGHTNGNARPASTWNPNAEALSSPAVEMLLTVVRTKRTNQEEYVRYADRLMNILAEEGLARLAQPTKVLTPCGECPGLAPVLGSNLCAVDIMRSGGILLEAVRRLVPDCKTAKILIQRDETTALPQLIYSKLPPNIDGCDVILCDPMLATGGSAITAIDVLKKAGVREERILFLNTVSCPEGLEAIGKAAPGVRILTAAVDKGLNEQKFIVPGLGDFGDRYYGSFGYREGLWGTGAGGEEDVQARM